MSTILDEQAVGIRSVSIELDFQDNESLKVKGMIHYPDLYAQIYHLF